MNYISKLVLVVALAFGSTSCSLISKVPNNPTVTGIIDCGKNELATAAQQLLSQVSAIIASGAAGWRDKLSALVKADGAEALACAVAQATADFQTNALASASAQNAERGAMNGSTFMAEQKYQFVSTPPKQ